MNKLKYILLLCLQMALIPAMYATTITGHIVNASVKKLYLSKIVYGTPDQMTRVDSADLKEGAFSLTHTVKEPGLYYLGIGTNNVKMYLKNDYKLEVNCDINQWPGSITFIGKNGGLENTIYLSMRLQFFNKYGLGDIMKYTANTYPQFTDSLSNAMYTEYTNLRGGSTVDPIFDSMMHTDIDYTKYGMMLAFNIVKSYYTTGKGSYNTTENPHYFDFLKKIEINSDAKSMSEPYIMFMMNYVHYNVVQALYKDKETPGFDGVNQLLWAKEHYRGKLRDYTVSQILKLRIDQNDVTNIKQQIDDYKTYNLDKDYYNRVANAYAKLAQFAPGNPFPDFAITDTAGHIHSMKELRGKIIYIDYWASWCGPCRMEMPHSREMIEKYKNNPNVAFVFVSIDSDKNAWINAMHKEKLKGLHLNASGGWSDAICRKYGINSIPRYMLIDKKGNIVNMEAKRPSAGVDKEIDELLNQK